MRIVDLIMRGPDSYWKAQFKAEEIKRKYQEADAECFRKLNESMKQDLDRLSDRALLQSRAIDGLTKENEKIKAAFEKYAGEQKEKLIAKDKEIGMLHEALRTERELNAALRTNSRLWENIKAEKIGSSGDCMRDPG